MMRFFKYKRLGIVSAGVIILFLVYVVIWIIIGNSALDIQLHDTYIILGYRQILGLSFLVVMICLLAGTIIGNKLTKK
jgi:hypothetical protein